MFVLEVFVFFVVLKDLVSVTGSALVVEVSISTVAEFRSPAVILIEFSKLSMTIFFPYSVSIILSDIVVGLGTVFEVSIVLSFSVKVVSIVA